MVHLRIRHIGPIKDAELTLNRLNVFIGPQSSGKSTIAKIISYCSWVEKDIATHLSFSKYTKGTYFMDGLISFHKMVGYFQNRDGSLNDKAYIQYNSDVINIIYAQGETKIEWVDMYAYVRSKISYIPAERNMILLPEMEKMELFDNNIRSFLFDWFNARKIHSGNNSLQILSMPVQFYYDPNLGNRIKENSDKYDIGLDNASSGLQSLVPLITMIEYLTNWIYSHDTELSYKEKQYRDSVNTTILIEKLLKPFSEEKGLKSEDGIQLVKQITKLAEKKDKTTISLLNNWRRIMGNLFKTQRSNLIIEEPEENLFPSTQVDLIYYLLDRCFNSNRPNVLTLTTHSPYILYALNNCMLASLILEKMDDTSKDALRCKKSAIKPNYVSIYRITEEGSIVSIQEDDGLIGKNYFDDVMEDVMSDYYNMINYYE